MHCRKDYADGIVTTLYERRNHGETKDYIGDPVADSLAVITRRNSSILALADGVSWGQKSRLAATCSIYASVTYLNEHLPSCKKTREVFRLILKAFEKAHQCIVSQQGTMTTLCVGVVVPLPEKNRYAFCVVNVGDSYAYVFNRHYGVKEVTEASHPIEDARDMKHCGGALGPADGCNPDISNLTCSYVVLEKGDLVFLCSDGISDNFDPVVAKFSPKPNRNSVFSLSSNNSYFDCDYDNHKNIRRSLSETDDRNQPVFTDKPSPTLCSLCLNSSGTKRESPEAIVEKKNKRNSPEVTIGESKTIQLYPSLEDYSPKVQRLPSHSNSGNESGDDDKAQRRCLNCGDRIRRSSEWSILQDEGSDNSGNFDFASSNVEPTDSSKMSTSKSMDDFQLDNGQLKDSTVDYQNLKSKSCTNVNKDASSAMPLEKEATFSKLQNSSPRGRYMSQPSVDERTGRKLKEVFTAENCTPKMRRELALMHLNKVRKLFALFLSISFCLLLFSFFFFFFFFFYFLM